VAVVVIFGVLTTVAAFTPMLLLSGVSGKIWPNIPLVVIPVLLFSLAQCFLVLPAHLASLKPYRKEDDETPVGRVLHAVEIGLHWFIDRVYTPVLRLATNARYVTASIFVAMILLTVGIIGAGWVKTSFFPQGRGRHHLRQRDHAPRGRFRGDRRRRGGWKKPP
jgi:multidrug efflux pump subunit AcrB